MKARDIIAGWPRRGSTSKPWCSHGGGNWILAIKGCERCDGETNRAIEAAANHLNLELNFLGLMVGGSPVPSWEYDKQYREWQEHISRIRIRCIDGSLL